MSKEDISEKNDLKWPDTLNKLFIIIFLLTRRFFQSNLPICLFKKKLHLLKLPFKLQLKNKQKQHKKNSRKFNLSKKICQPAHSFLLGVLIAKNRVSKASCILNCYFFLKGFLKNLIVLYTTKYPISYLQKCCFLGN